MAWQKLLPKRRPGRKFDERRPLVFLHIPKSAGTSLTHALLEVLQPRNPAVSLFDEVLFGSFSDFSGFSSAERARIYLPNRSLPADADLIAGHVSFRRLARSYPQGQYITVLREPIARLISHWRYWRSHTDAQLRDVGAWADRVRIARGSLESFLQHPDIVQTTDNLYVRMLLYPHPDIPPDAPIHPRHYPQLVQEALRELRRFSVVGILEERLFEKQLSEFLDRDFFCPKDNVTSQRASSDTNFDAGIETNVWDLLESRTHMDRKLWRFFCSQRLSQDACDKIERKTIALEFYKITKVL